MMPVRMLALAGVVALAACTARGDEKPVGTPVTTVPQGDTPAVNAPASPLAQHGTPQEEPELTGTDQLAGTSWEWLHTQSPVDKAEPAEPKNYVLTFTTDGRVTGTADCNRMLGTYRAGDRQVQFRGLATTRRMCPPGSLGDRFARELNVVRIYTFFTPDTLRMDMLADGGTLTFRRAR
jgi:heat shock protein HslJ